MEGHRPERAIGCVVDPACEVVSRGLIVDHEFKRFTIGEPVEADRRVCKRSRGR